MLFRAKSETADLLQQKEGRLAELTAQSQSAIALVQKTVADLGNVNGEIAETVQEIDQYIDRLTETKNGLDTMRVRNEKVMRNFEALLCLDE